MQDPSKKFINLPGMMKGDGKKANLPDSKEMKDACNVMTSRKSYDCSMEAIKSRNRQRETIKKEQHDEKERHKNCIARENKKHAKEMFKLENTEAWLEETEVLDNNTLVLTEAAEVVENIVNPWAKTARISAKRAADSKEQAEFIVRTQDKPEAPRQQGPKTLDGKSPRGLKRKIEDDDVEEDVPAEGETHDGVD